jgi:hypothetical protein
MMLDDLKEEGGGMMLGEELDGVGKGGCSPFYEY